MSRDPHRNRAYWVHSQEAAGIAHDAASENPPCPGQCNTQFRRAKVEVQPDGTAQHVDGDGRVIRPVPGQPIWCRKDADRITSELRRLPALAAKVVARRDGRLLTGTDHGDRTRTSTRTGSPSPSPAFDVVDDLASWLEDTAAELAEGIRAPWGVGRGSREKVRQVPAVTTWLGRRVTALLCHDTLAVDAGRAILSWAARLERAAGQDRLQHRLPLPCPACDLLTLVRDDGAAQVDCAACGRSWPESHYRHLVDVLADEARRAS